MPETLLELATVEEPRLRITRRQLGQASLASVARGRVSNGDELARRRRVVHDPPSGENSNAIAPAVAEGELGADLPTGLELRVPRLDLVTMLRGPEGEWVGLPEKLLAIESEQVAETPVDRDDTPVADEHEAVGYRR